VLQPGELVTEIVIPPARGSRNGTFEVGQKQALDWPLATASVSLVLRSDVVTSARVVLGHVAPTPWMAPAANEYLKDKTLTNEVADHAGWAALMDATPLSQNKYKVQLARTAVKRALLEARGRG
jgi:xanthine dehydrogenase YagS FAD-binding subunit